MGLQNKQVSGETAVSRRCSVAVGVLLLFAPAAGADALDALNERARAIALEGRCALASEQALTALAAGRLVARGALIRAGYAAAALDAFEAAAAAETLAIDCAGDDARAQAERIASAYRAWTSLRAMDFPASERGWAATRPYPSEDVAWVVRQDIGARADQCASFGVARARGETGLAVVITGGRPRSARLLLRDRARADGVPSLDLVRLLAGPNADALALRAWPDAFTTAHWAARSDTGAAAQALSGCETDARAAAFWFDDRARDALAALDPRESVYVEFDFVTPAGDIETRRALVEVGDFAAALAFVTTS